MTVGYNESNGSNKGSGVSIEPMKDMNLHDKF